MTTQKIVPHLWFNKEAIEAAEFYTAVFPNSKITHKSIIKNTPSGDCDIVGFRIMGFNLMSISAGPYFKINPSISFTINCKTKKEVDEFFEKLSGEGKVLMPLDKYQFSERYAWVTDKYGVSWQLILVNQKNTKLPKIVPSLLFVRDKFGKAEEAMNFYLSVFKNSKKGNLIHYAKGQEPNVEGTVMIEEFMLENVWLIAMDGALEHNFTFNEAVSFMVNCKNQEEIDYYWEKLSTVTESEQCGWLKDKYGISWQIIPQNMGKLMSKNPSKTTPAMLKMKKIIIDDLEKAGNK
ncbi:MAG: VOC family protein [archaeon]|jgi:predicted 3-demethylubiquinone-9 3-methyltransferase (glyoxalase superfamily)